MFCLLVLITAPAMRWPTR